MSPASLTLPQPTIVVDRNMKTTTPRITLKGKLLSWVKKLKVHVQAERIKILSMIPVHVVLSIVTQIGSVDLVPVPQLQLQVLGNAPKQRDRRRKAMILSPFCDCRGANGPDICVAIEAVLVLGKNPELKLFDQDNRDEEMDRGFNGAIGVRAEIAGKARISIGIVQVKLLVV